MCAMWNWPLKNYLSALICSWKVRYIYFCASLLKANVSSYTFIGSFKSNPIDTHFLGETSIKFGIGKASPGCTITLEKLIRLSESLSWYLLFPTTACQQVEQVCKLG